MNHAQEVAAVRASEQLAPTSSERHGGPYPLRTTLFPGTLRMADAPVSEQSRVHAPRPVETGHDGRVEGSSRNCRGCGRRWGTLTTDRFITGESSWEGDLCGSCVWDRECDGPTPRQIPGARRAA